MTSRRWCVKSTIELEWTWTYKDCMSKCRPGITTWCSTIQTWQVKSLSWKARSLVSVKTRIYSHSSYSLRRVQLSRNLDRFLRLRAKRILRCKKHKIRREFRKREKFRRIKSHFWKSFQQSNLCCLISKLSLMRSTILLNKYSYNLFLILCSTKKILVSNLLSKSSAFRKWKLTMWTAKLRLRTFKQSCKTFRTKINSREPHFKDRAVCQDSLLLHLKEINQ